MLTEPNTPFEVICFIFVLISFLAFITGLKTLGLLFMLVSLIAPFVLLIIIGSTLGAIIVGCVMLLTFIQFVQYVKNSKY